MAPKPTNCTATRPQPRNRIAALRRFLPLMLALTASGCGTLDSIKQSLLGGGARPGDVGYVKGFYGAIVADEPNAALVGKEVLTAGGNAVDAAVATGLALSVTLPSRAGLGGGGACVVYMTNKNGPARGVPEALTFLAPAARAIGGGDRPAAVPMTARGLFLMHSRYGQLPFNDLIIKAERLARNGIPVSRALARDLALVYAPLSEDPGARSVFGTRSGPLTEGQGLVQPALAATLAQLRVQGVGDLYQGQIGHRIEEVSPVSGTPIGLADLRTALPSLTSPVTVPYGDDMIAFPPTDGGLGAAAAFTALRAQPADARGAYARSLAAAALWETGRATADQVVNGPASAPASTPLYPASTSVVTLDADGNAAICDFSMNNLFGTGRMIPGYGFLAATSPAVVPRPLLAGALAWNPRKQAFRAAVGASGQAGAALAAAYGMNSTLTSRQTMPVPVPEPGRANAIACSDYLPGSEQSCTAVADSREPGLALTGR
jgi:gamma-glutamyltranspeptidase/glutathione hydrolase